MRGLSDSRTNREKNLGICCRSLRCSWMNTLPGTVSCMTRGKFTISSRLPLVCVDPDPGMLSCNGALSSEWPSLMGVRLVSQSFPVCSAPFWTCGCYQNPMRPRGAETGRVGIRILSLCCLQSQARERDNEADDTRKERNKTSHKVVLRLKSNCILITFDCCAIICWLVIFYLTLAMDTCMQRQC